MATPLINMKKSPINTMEKSSELRDDRRNGQIKQEQLRIEEEHPVNRAIAEEPPAR